MCGRSKRVTQTRLSALIIGRSYALTDESDNCDAGTLSENFYWKFGANYTLLFFVFRFRRIQYIIKKKNNNQNNSNNNNCNHGNTRMYVSYVYSFITE